MGSALGDVSCCFFGRIFGGGSGMLTYFNDTGEVTLGENVRLEAVLDTNRFGNEGGDAERLKAQSWAKITRLETWAGLIGMVMQIFQKCNHDRRCRK